MENLNVERIVARLRRSGIMNPATIQGCRDEEIASVEQQLGREIPNAYRQFLKMMGNGAPRFYTGADWECPKLPRLQRSAKHLLQECDAPFALPEEAVVFVVDQGFQFWFFDANEGADPPVYFYSEDDESAKQVAESFSHWLAGAVNDEIEQYKENHPGYEEAG